LLQRHVFFLDGLTLVVGEIDGMKTSLIADKAAAWSVITRTAPSGPQHELMLMLTGFVAQQVDR
jgi:hypothetical protein